MAGCSIGFYETDIGTVRVQAYVLPKPVADTPVAQVPMHLRLY